MPSAKKEKPETFGTRLSQARRELGVRERKDISPTDLAARLRVAQATVYRWENDEKSPRDDTLLQLATVLGVTPGWLKFGQEPKHQPLDESKLEPLDLPATVKVAPRKGKTG